MVHVMTGAMTVGTAMRGTWMGTGTWGVAAAVAVAVAVLFHRLLLILVTENMIIFTDE